MEAILLIGPLCVEYDDMREQVKKETLHVHNVGNLFSPVSDAKFSLFKLLHHLLLLVWVLCSNILHVFHESLHIA